MAAESIQLLLHHAVLKAELEESKRTLRDAPLLRSTPDCLIDLICSFAAWHVEPRLSDLTLLASAIGEAKSLVAECAARITAERMVCAARKRCPYDTVDMLTAADTLAAVLTDNGKTAFSVGDRASRMNPFGTGSSSTNFMFSPAEVSRPLASRMPRGYLNVYLTTVAQTTIHYVATEALFQHSLLEKLGMSEWMELRGFASELCGTLCGLQRRFSGGLLDTELGDDQ